MRVWFETRPVADLMPGPLGPSMTYAPEWLSLGGAFPVSTRMPLRAAPYGPAEVIPWVVNLLPESQNLEALVRLTRIAEQDVLGLLEADALARGPLRACRGDPLGGQPAAGEPEP